MALKLMSENGVHAMSMRRLADACGLNVATIYHYFPSKADLLTEVIAQRSYDQLLEQPPPVDRSLAPRARMEQMLSWIWTEMAGQDDMWRLLLGESLRGEPEALTSAAELSATFERALKRWISEWFDDVIDEPAVMARVLRGVIYGFFVEHLPLRNEDRSKFLRQRAREVAAVLVRDSA
ncbi:MAG: TetR/AcrR family transcriptional regulator [Acidimicrobiales bacterium]|nr:TetR/AcrR family transcriptional regulator [Acidimicrobiales bacterium]